MERKLAWIQRRLLTVARRWAAQASELAQADNEIFKNRVTVCFNPHIHFKLLRCSYVHNNDNSIPYLFLLLKMRLWIPYHSAFLFSVNILHGKLEYKHDMGKHFCH